MVLEPERAKKVAAGGGRHLSRSKAAPQPAIIAKPQIRAGLAACGCWAVPGKPDAGAHRRACLTQAVDQGSDYAAGEGDRQRQQPEAAGKAAVGGRP